MKALLAGGGIDTSPEPAGHVGYFLFGYVPDPYTVYRGVRALEAGHTLTLKQGDAPRIHRYFDLQDGSSNTLFIGEKHTYAGDLGWMSGTRATLRNTGVSINSPAVRNVRTRRYWQYPTGSPPGLEPGEFTTEAMPSDEEMLDSLFGEKSQRSRILSGWPIVDERATVYELDDSYENGMGGMSGAMGGMSGAPEDTYDAEAVARAEAAMQLTLSVFTENPTLAVGGFGSQHPGGAQFALGDGSVRFCAETIDPTTFLQLGHRADGRLTGDEW